MDPSNEILNELSDISKILMSADRDNSLYGVPADYFENFAGSVLARIRLSSTASGEIEGLSPLLAKAKGNNPYTVPDNYFTELTGKLSLSKTHQQPALVVPIQRRRSSWYKYAAAAVVAGMITTAGFFVFNNNHTDDPAGGLSKISDQEIVNYLQNEDLPLSETAGGSTAVIDFNDNDVKDLLSNISDNDLLQYSTDQGVQQHSPTTN